jgi:sodium-dependent dicarboxylate transporter 2/3/5
MAIWWVTGALPIYATACVPLVVFPWTRVFGEGPASNVAGAALPYLDPYIFLFLGGMCIAAAMQQWSLHRRIALTIMGAVGTHPRRLLFGFLLATAFVSMWISNTATAAMMFPIGLAVIAQFEERAGGRRLEHYGAAIMLAVAYASNVGGIGTKIGTAPNALFVGFMGRRGTQIDFLDYLAVGLPFVAVMLPLVWWALWRVGRRDELPAGSAGDAVREEIRRLGTMQRGERAVLAVFAATAAVWIGARPIAEALAPHVHALRLTTAHVEGGSAMLAALALLAWPVGATRALAPASLGHMPWGVLVLLGGGLSMAAGIDASGLGQWIGERLAGLRDAPALAQVGAASLVTVALSAVASNLATTAVMLNVLADSIAPDLAPTVLFAATIASSCDFALPAGTPPNAIVFASGYVSMQRMLSTGLLLDLFAAVLAALWCWIAVPLVL